MRNRRIIFAAVAAVLFSTMFSREAVAVSFETGDFVTHLQDDWGVASSAAGVLLDSHFNSLYGEVGYLAVGVLGSVGKQAMLFTSASSLFSYLPGSGLPGPLIATLVDPSTSASGIFGGEVVGLRLNVDFSDARLLGASATAFGDLLIHDYAPFDANGLTVREFLEQANLALAGGIPTYDYGAATALAQELNASFWFEGGTPSRFAQDHLQVVQPVPEPASLGLLGISVAAVAMRRMVRNGSRAVSRISGPRERS
jgi:hypothetical protein